MEDEADVVWKAGGASHSSEGPASGAGKEGSGRMGWGAHPGRESEED